MSFSKCFIALTQVQHGERSERAFALGNCADEVEHATKRELIAMNDPRGTVGIVLATMTNSPSDELIASLGCSILSTLIERARDVIADGTAVCEMLISVLRYHYKNPMLAYEALSALVPLIRGNRNALMQDWHIGALLASILEHHKTNVPLCALVCRYVVEFNYDPLFIRQLRSAQLVQAIRDANPGPYSSCALARLGADECAIM